LSPTIWNYPYSEVISMPGLSDSAVNTPFIIFGDLQNLAVGRRVQSMALEVNRLATEAWTGNKTWFKIYQRWGMKIGLEKAFVRIKTGSGS
jgi:HK97 family phage major capsid protein